MTMKRHATHLLLGFTVCAPFAAPAFAAPAFAAPPVIAQLRSEEASRLFTVPLPSKSKTPQPPPTTKGTFALGLWNGGSPKLLALNFRIETLSGQVLAQKNSQALAPNGATTVREWFPLSKLGVYRVQLTARPLRPAEGKWQVQDSLTFAVVTEPFNSRPRNNAINLMAAAPAGAAWSEENLSIKNAADDERRNDRIAPEAEYQGDFYGRLGSPVRRPVAVPPAGSLGTGPVAVLPLASDSPETSAATYRALKALARTSDWPNGETAIAYARGTDAKTATGPALEANTLIARAATALCAGSTEVSALFPSRVPKNEAGLARAAAWSALIRAVGGGRSDGELFPAAPLLRAASFDARGERVAIIWAERNDNPRARIVLPLKDSRLFDIWGNELRREQNGKLVVPLGGGPVYVKADVRQKTWRRAWKSASLEGLRPLAAQVLPFTRQPGLAGGSTRALQLRVRVQNMTITPFMGTLQVAPPPGWSLQVNNQSIKLQPGEARVLSFPVGISRQRPDGEYPVSLTAARGTSKWSWKQTARSATAQKTTDGVAIDGDLREWQGAAWMEINVKGSPEPARLAVRWDERNLYFAVRVREERLKPRRDGANYDFWDGHDAVQLAFGLADTRKVKPGPEPFNDTDYGFLLAPFSTEGGEPVGRVLRLWNGTAPFALTAVRDRIRFGGAVPGARCAIGRNEKRGLTFYEASLPLAEMPSLRPQMRANGDIPVRFSWRLHDDGDGSVSWSRANSVFPWWAGNGSFWPPRQILLPAQTPLGFSARPSGPRKPLFELLPLPVPAPSSETPPDSPAPTLIPFPIPTPAPAASPAPTPTPTPRPRRTAPRRPAFDLPEVAPMPPSSLPPAAPEPDGEPIRPSQPDR